MLHNNHESNHLFVDNGFIYFQDGEYICRLNTTDFTTEIVAQTGFENESSYHNTYMVINGYLYYWDNSIHATVALNIENMESMVISEQLYCYCQYYNNGILVFRVEEHNTVGKVDDNVLRFPSGTYMYYNLCDGLFAPERTIPLIMDYGSDSLLYMLYKGQSLLYKLNEDSYYFVEIGS